MAETDQYMLDTPLPDALDFDVLKSSGIAQLKHLVGEVWTHYNDSDPGVTILDQLCYALTELGYCAQFPIEDVLTDEHGNIHYEGQFFAPQDILTTAPVTIDDYRRLVHDRFEAVEAIYITARDDEQSLPTGCYVSYLQLDSGLKKDESEQLIQQVHNLLNRHRNLAEVFARPRLLQTLPISLEGTLNLTTAADFNRVSSQVMQALKACTRVPTIRSGYQQLRDTGMTADQIFNGPSLEKGWIAPDALGSKITTFNLYQLTTLLGAIEGVALVDGLKFTGQDQDFVEIGPEQIAVIDGSHLNIVRHTLSQPTPDGLTYLSQMRARHQAVSVESRVDRYPLLPEGHYRNIEQYYSIQNTFPDIYAVGANSLESSLPISRVASSRQLRGYLLVYDQLLANQFSQLAHVGELFSFMPSTADSHAAAKRDKADGAGLAHSPLRTTYFCQPLYDVPDVMPLLRGNEAFRYQTDPAQPDQRVAREAWMRYQQQPFNPYLRGLRDMMESASQAEQRRDDMLSHLLARHGEQASLYDDMIRGCHWYGSEARTRCVVKSIWLQNYQRLSYHRASAFDPWQATPLAVLPDKGKAFIPRRLPGYPTIDGLLDEALVYSRARLRAADFINYSTFELKADILLGVAEYLSALATKIAGLLDVQDFAEWLLSPPAEQGEYRLTNADLSVRCMEGRHHLFEGNRQLMYIASAGTGRVSKDDYQLHMDQLHWLATQRKGFLLIEHVLLLPEDDLGVPAATPGFSDYFLHASLVFPGYVRRDVFKAFEGVLFDQHWPAHLAVRVQDMSHVALRALISQFVIWHNSMGNPPRRAVAARAVARLLKLSPLPEVPDADE